MWVQFKCHGGVLYTSSKLVGVAAFCCTGYVLEAHAQPVPAGEPQPVPRGPAQQQPSTPPSSASPRSNRLPTVMVQTNRVRRIRRATKPSLPPARPPTPAAARIASTPPPGISTGGTEGTATNGYKATTAANVGRLPLCQRRRDLPSVINEELGHWADGPIFQSNDRDREWLYRKFNRQSLEREAFRIELQQPIAEMSHETADQTSHAGNYATDQFTPPYADQTTRHGLLQILSTLPA
jgi:hypothetical protein